MTDAEALEVINDPFLLDDLESAYGTPGLAEAVRRAALALAEKVANER